MEIVIASILVIFVGDAIWLEVIVEVDILVVDLHVELRKCLLLMYTDVAERGLGTDCGTCGSQIILVLNNDQILGGDIWCEVTDRNIKEIRLVGILGHVGHISHICLPGKVRIERCSRECAIR